MSKCGKFEETQNYACRTKTKWRKQMKSDKVVGTTRQGRA